MHYEISYEVQQRITAFNTPNVILKTCQMASLLHSCPKFVCRLMNSLQIWGCLWKVTEVIASMNDGGLTTPLSVATQVALHCLLQTKLSTEKLFSTSCPVLMYSG